MNKFARELCSQENLKFDSNTNNYSGYRSGYPFFLSVIGKNYELVLSVNNGNFPDLEGMKQLVKACPAISSCKVSGYRVSYTIKRAVGNKSLLANISLAINSAVSFLSANGYFTCCEESGERDNVAVYTVAGAAKILSESRFLTASQQITAKEIEQANKKENVVAGIAGALIGAVLGAGAIVLIARLGYISLLGGALMGILTIRGYELLADKFSVKGILVSAVIILGMVYLSNRIDWAITIVHELEVAFWEAFTHVDYVVELAELKLEYYTNLALLYLFTVLGAIPMLISALKSHKVRKTAYKV